MHRHKRETLRADYICPMSFIGNMETKREGEGQEEVAAENRLLRDANSVTVRRFGRQGSHSTQRSAPTLEWPWGQSDPQKPLASRPPEQPESGLDLCPGLRGTQ